MNCKKVKKKLTLFIDNQLNELERKKIETHLSACPGCAEEAKAFAQSWEAIYQWEPLEPSEDFSRSFWQKVERQEKERKPSRRLIPFPVLRFVKVLVPVAIVLLLAFAFIFNLLHRPTFETAEAPPEGQAIYISLEGFEEIPTGSLADTMLTLRLNGDLN